MIKTLRTDSTNKDFIELVRHLDAYLAEMDGSEHAFYAQYNKVDMIKHVVVAFDGDQPVGCGAIKEYVPGTMEVKRMYTTPTSRGKGVATTILSELENWAGEMGYTTCVLETGKRQVEAVGLYQKNGYKTIPNYGQYEGIDNSVCFEKEMRNPGNGINP